MLRRDQMLKNISDSMEVIHLSDPADGVTTLYTELDKAKKQMQRTTLPIGKVDGRVTVDLEALRKIKEELNESATRLQCMKCEPQEGMTCSAQDIQKQLYQAQDVCQDVEELLTHHSQLKQTLQASHVFPEVQEAWQIWEERVEAALCETSKLKWWGENLDTLDEEIVGVLDAGHDISRDLNKELHAIRDRCPRMYFISNTEMMDMMGRYQDGEAMDILARGMFDAVDVELTEDKQEIIALVSAGNEKLKLKKGVSLKQDIAALINELVERMTEAVKLDGYQCLGAIGKSDVMQLMAQFIQQSILLAKKVKTTAETEQALKKQKYEEIAQTARDELREYAKIIATQQLQRKDENILSTMIVNSLHDRDVALQLANASATHESTEWLMQARIYPQEHGSAVLRIAQVELPITHDYINNGRRLVITPLTDKSYVSICNAVTQNQIHANVGQAGVGKTETAKDMSSLLGRRAVAVNASDEINQDIISRLLKGAAGSGSWLVMDQVNRLTAQAFSVLSRQLKLIYNALAQEKKVFNLDGTADLELRSTFAILFSYNPFYAGRTQIPESFRDMMRCNTLTVPDFGIISEAMLFTEGFTEAETLGRRLQKLFEIAQATLTQQEVYDFGLRAVKHVVLGSGRILRQNEGMNEASIMRYVIEQSQGPKLIGGDRKLFSEILNSLFSDMSPDAVSKLASADEGLVERLQEEFSKQGITGSDYLLERAGKLVTLTGQRHGLALVGSPFSGKSVVLEAAAKAVGAKLTHIFPKGMTETELYGGLKEKGVFSQAMREIAEEDSDQPHWIVLDGPIDPEWVESLNTLLDDNKKLYCWNGEVIPLKANTRVIITLEDMKNATPATISRLGIVSFEEELCSWTLRLQGQSHSLPELQETIGQGLDFMKSAKSLMELSDHQLAQNVLNLMGAQLKQGTGAIDSLLFAVIQGLGSLLTPEERPRFDTFVRSLKIFSKSSFPKKSSVFEVTLRREGHKDIWKPWLDDDTPSKLAPLAATVEMASQIELISLLVAQRTPVLLVGPPATGKTQCARSVAKRLEGAMPTKHFPLNRSSYTEVLKTFLDEAGGSKSLIFLDGLNLTGITKYGTNTAQEVVREFIHSERSQDVALIAAMDSSLTSGVSQSLLSSFTVIGFPELREESARCVLESITKHPGLLDATLQAYTSITSKVQCDRFNLADLENILRGVCQAQSEDVARVWAHEAYHIFSDRLRAQSERANVAEIINEVASSLFDAEIEVESLLWVGVGPRAGSCYEEKFSLQSVRNQVQEAVAVSCSEEDLLILESDEILEHFLHIARALRKEKSSLLLATEDAELSTKVTQLVTQTMKLQFYALNNTNWKDAVNKSIQESQDNQTEAVLLVREGNMERRMMLTLYNMVADALKENNHAPIHIVTITSPDLEEFAQKYPAMANKVVIDYFGGLTGESLKSMVQESLSQLKSQRVIDCVVELLGEKVKLAEVLALLRSLKGEYKKQIGGFTTTEAMCKEILKLLPTVKAIKAAAPQSKKKASVRSLKKEIDEISEAGSGLSVLTALTQRIEATYNRADLTELKAFSSPPQDVCVVMSAVAGLISPEMPSKLDWGLAKRMMANPKLFIQGMVNFEPNSVTPAKFKKIRQVTNDFDFTVESLMKKSQAVAGLGQWLLALRDYLVDRGISEKPIAQKPKEEEEQVEELKEEEKSGESLTEEDREKMMEVMEKGKISLQTIKPGDVTEMKSMKNPPQTLKLIMEGMCYLFGVKPVRVMNQTTFKKETDYWPPAKKLLGDVEFLKKCVQYDKDNISPQVVAKLKKILNNPACTENRVKNCSAALVSLRDWMEALVIYSTIREKEGPRRANSFIEKQEEEKKEENLDFSKLSVEKEIVEILEQPESTLLNNNQNPLRRALQNLQDLIAEERQKALQNALLTSFRRVSLKKRGDLKKVLAQHHLSSQVKFEKDQSYLDWLQDQLLHILDQSDLQDRAQSLKMKKQGTQRSQIQLLERILDLLRGGSRGSRTDLLMIQSLSEKFVEVDQAMERIQEEERALCSEFERMKASCEGLTGYATALLLSLKDLRRLNRFYSFSDQEFLRIFRRILSSEGVSQTKVKQVLLERVYRWVNSGLFEQDRFLFSFLLINRLETDSLHPNEFKFLVQPYGTVSAPNSSGWLSDHTWKELCWLSELPSFSGLSEAVSQSKKEWKKLLDRDEPHEYKLPGVWRQRLNEFHFLLVLRVLRPEKLPLAIESLVSNLLGDQFSSQQVESLQDVIKRTSAKTPIILNAKDDALPEAQLTKLAAAFKRQLTVIYASQEETYKSDIAAAARTGNWVYLAHNQSLNQNWTQGVKKVHPSFRLFLQANASLSDDLILTSAKYTLESATQFSDILLQTLECSLLQTEFDSASEATRKAIATLVILQSALSTQQANQTGRIASLQSLGLSDLNVALQALKMWEKSGSHLDTLRYMLAEIVYSARVIEQLEENTIRAAVNYFFPDSFFSDNHIVGKITPTLDSFVQFKHFCQDWVQENTDPLGIISSQQAAQSNQLKVKKLLSNAALVLSPCNESHLATIQSILAELPALSSYKPESASLLVTQVQREITAYNRKIESMRSNLIRLKNMLLLNHTLHQVDIDNLRSLQRGDLPLQWRRGIFNYTEKVKDAVELMKNGMHYFQNWSEHGELDSLYLNYFLNPQAYIIALRLSYASTKGVDFDDIHLTLRVEEDTESKDAQEKVAGEVFLEGAGWNQNKKQVDLNGDGQIKLVIKYCLREDPGTRGQKWPLILHTLRGQKGNLVGHVEAPVGQEEEGELRRRGVMFTLHKRV